jgi:hypothetical protein
MQGLGAAAEIDAVETEVKLWCARPAQYSVPLCTKITTDNARRINRAVVPSGSE